MCVLLRGISDSVYRMPTGVSLPDVHAFIKYIIYTYDDV